MTATANSQQEQRLYKITATAIQQQNAWKTGNIRSGQIHGDPTARCAESRLFFSDRMKLVEQAAIGADPEIYTYILRAVTEGLSYDTLKMQHGIPCCRDVYYDRYRRFFWLLDKTRD